MGNGADTVHGGFAIVWRDTRPVTTPDRRGSLPAEPYSSTSMPRPKAILLWMWAAAGLGSR
jgi:hypothetical protein